MMDAALIWIVAGLVAGIGAAWVVRRFVPSRQRSPAAQPPPANRQQARQREREARKRHSR